MSDEGVDTKSNEISDIPRYHLYIKASLIDNETQGACPKSQQGFMQSYILAQQKNVDFKVWTVNTLNPPQDFKDKNVGKIYPFIEGLSGRDTSGRPIAGQMPTHADDVDIFLDSVNTDCPQLKRPSALKDHILGKVDTLQTKFNAFLKGIATAQPVTNILQTVNSHLASQGTKFLEGEELSYTDCYFLPRLQHLRVAGKYYKGYEIPHEFVHLWRYLRDAYCEPAFHETLPADDDLLKFHYIKFTDTQKMDFKKQGISDKFGTKHTSVNLDEEDPDVLKKTTSIPSDVSAKLDGAGENGEQEQQEDGE